MVEPDSKPNLVCDSGPAVPPHSASPKRSLAAWNVETLKQAASCHPRNRNDSAKVSTSDGLASAELPALLHTVPTKKNPAGAPNEVFGGESEATRKG
jgi:hypothetical protein